MSSTPSTKSQETQTPPPPSSRPGSALSWADAVKSSSRSTTPDPSSSPARSSRAPSTASTPSWPPASAAAPTQQAVASTRRQGGSPSPSRRQQVNSSLHDSAPAQQTSSSPAKPRGSRVAAPTPALKQPPEQTNAGRGVVDDQEITDASAASAGSSSNSSKKRKKKKKAKAPPSSDGGTVSSDPRLDPDLVALEEARQLAAIPVEHVEWAKRVIKLAERYTNRMGNTGPEGMRLTRVDDELYTRFRADFPTFNVETIIQDELTGPGFAERWQALHADFADKLPAVYAHHLIRRVAAREYADDNTIMATGAQFYAIEIARNREGANQDFYEALKVQVNRKAIA